jgi:hypothetical protein
MRIVLDNYSPSVARAGGPGALWPRAETGKLT